MEIRKTNEGNKKDFYLNEKEKDIIFYSIVLAFPIAQFILFYIGVNVRSFLFAFQNINVADNTVTWTFENFANIFKQMQVSDLYANLFKTSAISYAYSLIVGVPLGLFFAFYIAEKLPFAGAMRVFLFLPSIISSITMVTIYRFLSNRLLLIYCVILWESR